ncbi:hypothetical protein [Francisella halioticida]|uniref:hypothetical protein n=1 Tax=Francisella halioticida TaxID=549298 RepID=UPI001BB375F9|nr:hypothetical protein [Francisella halioticida]
MGKTNEYNKENRKTLTIHFYGEEEQSYIEKFTEVSGKSNAKKFIHLVDSYNQQKDQKEDD